MFQKPVIVTTPSQEFSARITELRAKASELKLRASDLEVRKNQLGEQRRRLGADVSPAEIERHQVDVEHQLAATRIELEAIDQQIGDLETERDMSRAFSLQGPPGITTTMVPPDPLIAHRIELERGAAVGGFVLMLPFVLVFARRMWHRSGPRRVDPEDSARLQRVEQAVEAIAVEIERIGEAQRFTTKLLAERQPEPAPRIPLQSRREPGTVTPH